MLGWRVAGISRSAQARPSGETIHHAPEGYMLRYMTAYVNSLLQKRFIVMELTVWRRAATDGFTDRAIKHRSLR